MLQQIDNQSLEQRAFDSLQGTVAVKRLLYDSDGFDKLTHYLFRYPAKFHPPVVRALLEEYTRPGDWILDPFCGSGSLMIEAAVTGRNAIGTDVDPLAIFASQVKTRCLKIPHLSHSIEQLLGELESLERPLEEYQRRQFEDISSDEVAALMEAEILPIPAIPNIYHWFRCYVVVDLARILKRIALLDVPRTHRDFLRLCFASVIRSASNADPVPVSGLEVTAHMKRKEAQGRVVNPFDLFRKAVKRATTAITAYSASASREVKISAFCADATVLAPLIHHPINTVITSPPYHNAVDYYRRHQLEMFWLGLIENQAERLALLPRYIGRPRVAQRHPFVATEHIATPLARKWEFKMRKVSGERSNDFKHYVVAMHKTFQQLGRIITKDGYALFVVGHSAWNGSEIPTADLFVELADASFSLVEQLSYPIKNRYMSYSRHNGANIDHEYVLVFRRNASSIAIPMQ